MIAHRDDQDFRSRLIACLAEISKENRDSYGELDNLIELFRKNSIGSLREFEEQIKICLPVHTTDPESPLMKLLSEIRTPSGLYHYFSMREWEDFAQWTTRSFAGALAEAVGTKRPSGRRD